MISRILLATSLLFGSAFAYTPDDCLRHMPEQATRVVVIPSIERLATPLDLALTQLQSHKAFSFLTELTNAVQINSGFDFFDPKAHQKLGLEIEGPLVIGFSEQSALYCFAFHTPDDAEDWLLSLGQKPTHIDPALAISVAPSEISDLATTVTAPYLQLQNGYARLDGSLLYLSTDRALLDGATQSWAMPNFEVCPAQPGEADLYAIDPNHGCVTARLDPDLLRVEGNLRAPFPGWIAPKAPALDHALGPGQFRFTLAISETARRAMETLFRAKLPAIAQAFDGRIGLSAGPDLASWTLVLGLQPHQESLLQTLLPALQKLKIDQLRIESASNALRLSVPKPKNWPKALPYLDQLELRIADDLFWITTRTEEPKLPEIQNLSARPYLNQSALSLYTALSGAPHNGQDFADALTPFLTALEITPQKIQTFTSGLAFLTAWIGEWAFGLNEEANRWRFIFEASLL